MFILRESIWWVLAAGLIGFFMGRPKGLAQWGLVLGLAFGPIGWGLVLILPARTPRPTPGRPAPGGPAPGGGYSAAGRPACPRCGKGVGRRDRACPHCGNVLMPIRYRVLSASPGKDPDGS